MVRLKLTGFHWFNLNKKHICFQASLKTKYDVLTKAEFTPDFDVKDKNPKRLAVLEHVKWHAQQI